jgi:hypothetical protein
MKARHYQPVISRKRHCAKAAREVLQSANRSRKTLSRNVAREIPQGSGAEQKELKSAAIRMMALLFRIRSRTI